MDAFQLFVRPARPRRADVPAQLGVHPVDDRVVLGQRDGRPPATAQQLGVGCERLDHVTAPE